MSFLCCPVASEHPIHCGAGGPVSEGYRSHLFQDVPDQNCYLLTSRIYVLGLACRPFCKIRSFQLFAFSRCSLRRTTTRRSSSFYTFPLETGCSPSSTADITAYYRLGWMWPLPFRRYAMHYLEHHGSRWIDFLPNRRTESSNSNISRNSLMPTTFLCLQEVHG